MSKISSGVTLTSDFYLSNFYQANRSARKTSGRKELTTSELSYEDARALKRAVSRLGSIDFTDDENIDNIYSTITAFADTYNNTLSSTSKSSDSDLSKYAKQLKSLANKYSDKLESVGITVEKDGSLSVNEDLLKAKDVDDLKKVFTADDSNFIKTTGNIARKLKNNSYDSLYQQMTGNGGQLNITV
jgi:ABC-type transporter Mla subunit MlaD